MSSPGARAWITLNLDHLRHNVKLLRTHLPNGCSLMPVLKADAYGHGAVSIAKELDHLGVDAFCTATAEEAAALRQAGVRGTLLVLGYTPPEQFDLLVRHDLTQTVVDHAYGALLNRAGERVRVHIAVDTGMHRLGEDWAETAHIAEILRMRHLKVEGLFTHLCAGDLNTAEGRFYTLSQGKAMQQLLQALEARSLPCPAHHILNSAGLLRYPELGGRWARVGIALYGVLSTRAELDGWAAGLRPVLTVSARVALVRRLRRGEYAGYGLAFQAPKDMALAVLAIGYGDGLPRALSCGRGRVLIQGQSAPIIGQICMDQTLVDITDIPALSAGEPAVVLGVSGDRSITAYDWAEASGTITNEILCRLGPRLERQ